MRKDNNTASNKSLNIRGFNQMYIHPMPHTGIVAFPFLTSADWDPIFALNIYCFETVPTLIKKPLQLQGSSTKTQNTSLQRHRIFIFPVHYFCWCICGRALHWGVSQPLQHFSTLGDNERNFTQWIHFSLSSHWGEIAGRGEGEKTGCSLKTGTNTCQKREEREWEQDQERAIACWLNEKGCII